jgi:hypothetical protein
VPFTPAADLFFDRHVNLFIYGASMIDQLVVHEKRGSLRKIRQGI